MKSENHDLSSKDKKPMPLPSALEKLKAALYDESAKAQKKTLEELEALIRQKEERKRYERHNFSWRKSYFPLQESIKYFGPIPKSSALFLGCPR